MCTARTTTIRNNRTWTCLQDPSNISRIEKGCPVNICTVFRNGNIIRMIIVNNFIFVVGVTRGMLTSADIMQGRERVGTAWPNMASLKLN